MRTKNLLLALGMGATIALFPAVSSAADAPAKAPAAKPGKLPLVHGHPMMDGEDKCEGKEGHGMHGMMGGMGEHGMGGAMMGHGMGMMGGGMSGGGMMGGHGMMGVPRIGQIMALDLSAEQRSKINKISDELQHKNWGLMGSMNDETAVLRDLYQADKRDPATIGKEYAKIFDLKRQMIEATVDAQNRIDEVLTADQRKQMKDLKSRMPMRGYSGE